MGSGTGMSTSFERDRQEEGKLLTHSTIASDDTEVLGLARRILILFGSYIFNRICHFAVWLSCDAQLVVPSFAALRPEQRTALITGLSLLVFRIVVLIIEVYMASLPSLAFDHLVQELEVKSMQVHIKTYCLEDGRVQQSRNWKKAQLQDRPRVFRQSHAGSAHANRSSVYRNVYDRDFACAVHRELREYQENSVSSRKLINFLLKRSRVSRAIV